MENVFNTALPVALGADHAGFSYKEAIKNWLISQQILVTDFGTNSADSVDYPDFAHPTAIAVESGKASFGILFCGSANGVAITANKHQGIRAGLSFTKEVASLIRQHNNANIICIPARFVSVNEAIEMVSLFMKTPFEGGRHAARVNKISC